MARDAIVCDTTVLLYLGRVDEVDLLPALFSEVHVPEPVLLELDMGRLIRADTIDPRNLAWTNPVLVPTALIDDLPLNRLGPGERAVSSPMLGAAMPTWPGWMTFEHVNWPKSSD